jgi:hypothetical protein
VRDAFSSAERKLKNLAGKRVASRHKGSTEKVALSSENDVDFDDEFDQESIEH